MEQIKIKIRVNGSNSFPTKNSIGYDLFSKNYLNLKPFHRILADTGVEVEIPPGYYGKILPSDKMAERYGLGVLAGVIYPGKIQKVEVCLVNLNGYDFIRAVANPENNLENYLGTPGEIRINPTIKIAQLVIERYIDGELELIKNEDN